MIKMRTLVVSITLCLSLAGCASTSFGPAEGYKYMPKELSTNLRSELYEFAKKTTEDEPLVKMEFIDELALLEITVKAEPDMVFLSGANNYFEKLCTSDNPFFKAVRESGVGFKYELTDARMTYKMGPWNSDACL